MATLTVLGMGLYTPDELLALASPSAVGLEAGDGRLGDWRLEPGWLAVRIWMLGRSGRLLLAYVLPPVYYAAQGEVCVPGQPTEV